MEIPGVLLLALTILGVLAAAVACVVSLMRGRAHIARPIAMVAVAWIAAYAALLIVTSLASRERTLALGETKRFCGFYLDCHMGVAVERVDTMSSIGDLRAGGTFYVVTLRVSSDARRVSLRLEQPSIAIVDAEGFRYDRSRAAERRLARDEPIDLEHPVEAGHSFSRAVVIDVPHGVRNPRLRVTMGGSLDRAVELAVIGDEDAFLHAPTLHALVPGSGVSSASAGAR
jgi:hypothetical protein